VGKLNTGMQLSESSTNRSFEKSNKALASRRFSASTRVIDPQDTSCIGKKQYVRTWNKVIHPQRVLNCKRTIRGRTVL